MKKRIFCIFLLVVMVFTSIDTTAFAQESIDIDMEAIVTTAEDEIVREEATSLPTEEEIVATMEPAEEVTIEPSEEPFEKPTTEVTCTPEAEAEVMSPTPEVKVEEELPTPEIESTEEAMTTPEIGDTMNEDMPQKAEDIEGVPDSEPSQNDVVKEEDSYGVDAENNSVNSAVSAIVNDIVQNYDIYEDNYFRIVTEESDGNTYKISVSSDLSRISFAAYIGNMLCMSIYDCNSGEISWTSWTFVDEIGSMQMITDLDISNYRYGDILKFVQDPAAYTIGNNYYLYEGSIQEDANSCLLIGLYNWNNIIRSRTNYSLEDIGFEHIFEESTDDWEKYFSESVFVNGVKLNQNTFELSKGHTGYLTATVYPYNATNQKVFWSSSDENVITVSDSGVVNTINEGTANVIVETEDGEFIAKCQVTVKGLYSDTEHYQSIRSGLQMAKKSNMLDPQSIWMKSYATFQRYSHNAAIDYIIRLDEMYLGTKATEFVKAESSTNKNPSSTQQWIVFKFYLENRGDETLRGRDVITDLSSYNIYYTRNGASIKPQTATFLYKSDEYDLSLEPSASGYAWVGILIDKSVGFPYLKMINGYDKEKREAQYVWFDTDPRYGLFRVEFDGNGGEIAPTYREVFYGGTYENMPKPMSREGYDFAGWSTSKDGSQIIANDTIVSIKSNHTLYAIWTPKQYMVSFDGNGGKSNLNSMQVTYHASYGELPVATREGYTFMGWYDAAEGGKKIETDTIIDYTTDRTLYAQWIANQYIVSFNSSGGSIIENKKQVTYDDVYGELPEPNDRYGYSFGGWYTEPDEGIKIVAESVVKILENQILYARWIPNKYVITFDSMGGEQIESVLGEYMQSFDCSDYIPKKSNSLFVGWYKDKAYEKRWTNNDIITGDITLYARWQEIKNGFFIIPIENQIYTGKAIKPVVKVYDGETLLIEKTDYTVSYKNNTKANDASKSKTAPTITVTGKGNYSGTETVTFKILKKDIADIDIIASDITVTYNKKAQKKVPTVKRGSTSLKKNTDFTVSYPDLADNPKAYKAPGTYTILVKGKGDYTGQREVKLTITESKLMSKVTVSKIATQPYTGAAITTATMTKVPTVKYGDKTKLKEGIHYTMSYENNIKIGTATMTLTGTDKETPEGTFTGTKKVTFKIGGTSLAKATVTGVPSSMTYTGLEIDERTENWGNPIKVVLNGDELTRAADADSEGDYIVTLSKNTSKGTATVTIKGINAYSGSVKKEFVINAYNINDNTKQNLVTEEMETDTIYVKGGTKPEPVVKFGETTLVKGKDYTLTYANNTKWNDGTGIKQPTVTITGKGNFKGSVKLYYTIDKQDIHNLSISATDVVYKKEKGAYKTVPVVKDLNNKALKNKTDFTVVSYTYGEDVTLKNGTERQEGEPVGKNDIVPADTLISVTVTGKGNYTNDTPLVAEYRVVKSSVASAKVTVPSQKYTGKPITIEDKTKIKVMVGKTRLDSEDFEIVDGSFKNNTKAGTANFTIKGVGNYGGTKKVTFKIKPKGFIWWWRE